LISAIVKRHNPHRTSKIELPHPSALIRTTKDEDSTIKKPGYLNQSNGIDNILELGQDLGTAIAPQCPALLLLPRIIRIVFEH
jgi:hypothetical protein